MRKRPSWEAVKAAVSGVYAVIHPDPKHWQDAVVSRAIHPRCGCILQRAAATLEIRVSGTLVAELAGDLLGGGYLAPELRDRRRALERVGYAYDGKTTDKLKEAITTMEATP